MGTKKLFCEYGTFFYAISVARQIMNRHFTNMLLHKTIAKTYQQEYLPHIAARYTSPMVVGTATETKKNRANNLALSSAVFDKLIIQPGETFSFWQTLGKCTRRKGYKEGPILQSKGVATSVGGGLCQLATHINNLVLNSPLQITELHHHSDALYPDTAERIPYSLGTSVLYNYKDYCFLNTIGQVVQLHFWHKGTTLFGNLLSEAPFEHSYRILEEGHHYAREGEEYFRNSKIFKLTLDKISGNIQEKLLVRDNHSKVMYDPALIPAELLRT